MTETLLREWVRDYYGRVLEKSDDLKTNACCASGPPPSWLRPLLANIHDDVLDRFYGCGFPIPEALRGRTALDLGCGTGRDVYLLSQLVGADGRVHGVDMTEGQIQVARETLDWHMDHFGYGDPNAFFHLGFIEDLRTLDIAPESVDVTVSNCVFNLSPRKDLVLAEVFRLLKPGGELYFSDVFADRRLPEAIAQDPVLYGECLGGAMYEQDFLSLARRAGFLDPRVVASAPVTIDDDEVQRKVGAARFRSVTLRLFKLPDLEERCEDYGQVAVYEGTAEPVGPLFVLDDHHWFEAGRPERVCGNTADMLASTRFAEHFEVIGDKSVHYGEYPCGPTLAAGQYASDEAGEACC